MEPYFSNVYKPANSTGHPPPIRTRHRLFVDNRDRPAGTDPFNFAINLETCGVPSYNNVTSVELKGISVPKVAGEPYAILSIPELNDDVLDSTTPAANRAYAVVYFDNNQMTTGWEKPVKGADFYQKTIEYHPPLRRLDRLSISVLKHDGTVVTSADTGNVTTMSLLFEIVSGVRST